MLFGPFIRDYFWNFPGIPTEIDESVAVQKYVILNKTIYNVTWVNVREHWTWNKVLEKRPENSRSSNFMNHPGRDKKWMESKVGEVRVDGKLKE